MSLQVTQIKTEEQFLALEPEWNALLQESDQNEIALTWEWMYTWWHVFKDPSRALLILTLRNLEGHLVGIAPFQIMKASPCPSLPAIRQIAFLGYGEAEGSEICSDYLNLIIRKGDAPAVITKIVDYLTNDLAGQWDEVLLHAISEDSENIRELKATIGSTAKIKYRQADKGSCYYVPLPKSWDLFLTTQSGNFKRKYRYYLKQLSSKGRVTYGVVNTAEELEKQFDTLAKLHQKRWVSKGRPGVFSSKPFLMFHGYFSKIALKNGWLHLRFLYLDDNPIAAIYSFAYDGKVSFYQAGITPMDNDISLGTLMIGHCIEESISQGMREYDFMRGSDAYKKTWTKTYRKMTTIRIFPNKGKVRLLRVLGAVKVRLKKIVYLFQRIKRGVMRPIS